MECPRYLDNLGQTLNSTFVLELKDNCSKTFTLKIRERESSSSATSGNVLMVTSFQNNTQARMQLKNFPNKSGSANGTVNFGQFFLTLVLYKRPKNTYEVQVAFHSCYCEYKYVSCKFVLFF